MPINLFNNPLSSIKLGADNILKGYIGNGQIFPNNTEITAAAFTDTYIANTGGNTPYVVSGDIGSSFTLTGSAGATTPSGTQVISSSPTTYQIAIGDQSTICDAIQRNSQVVITPQGDTALASGLSNADTIIQYAGPVSQTNNIGLTISVSNTNYAVQNIGGVLKWVTGAAWSVTISYTVGSLGQSAVGTLRGRAFSQNSAAPMFPSNIAPSGTAYSGQVVFSPGNPPSGNYSATYTMQTTAGVQYVSFTAIIDNATSACYLASPGTVTTGNLFP